MIITLTILAAGSALIPALVGGELINRSAEKARRTKLAKGGGKVDQEVELFVQQMIAALGGNRKARDIPLTEVVAILKNNSVSVEGFTGMSRGQLIALIEESNDKSAKTLHELSFAGSREI